MKLDRAIQLQVLQKLSETYPKSGTIKEETEGPDVESYKANIHYLKEHGLVESPVSKIGTITLSHGPRITAKGMDFLANDGGLSAILGVVTVRLHDDTIKELVAARITASDLSQPDKQRYLDRLRELPAETTKHLVLKLVDLGLDKGPQAIAAIGTFLSNHLPG